MTCDLGLSGYIHVAMECQLKSVSFRMHVITLDGQSHFHEMEYWGILCNNSFFSICTCFKGQMGNDKIFIRVVLTSWFHIVEVHLNCIF